MKKFNFIENIKNNSIKDGYPLNSKYWQDYKKSISSLSNNLYEIAIGCMLGDACMYRISKNTKIKIEQSYIHKDYLFSAFGRFI